MPATLMPWPVALPPTLRFWHPACLIATWFGTGLLPVAPGTFASLAAVPLAWLIQAAGGSWAVLAAAVAAFAVGWLAATIYARRSGQRDPGPVVVDEVAAQWLVLALTPAEPLPYAVGFIAFRFFDIVKPWPISWVDRRWHGGFGIMFDDVLAAGYAVLVVAAFVALTP